MTETAELPRVEIATDGACKGNPGRGGWGAVLRAADDVKAQELDVLHEAVEEKARFGEKVSRLLATIFKMMSLIWRINFPAIPQARVLQNTQHQVFVDDFVNPCQSNVISD